MNILVLGSEGQIGKPLCEYAYSKNHTVFKFDKKLNSVEQDLSKNNCLQKVLTENKIDVVLFLAFEVGGSKYLQEVDKNFSYISENVRLMENTFELLNKYKIPFLFASSQMANMHHTNYGFLKDLGERYTKALNGWICRFWNVYGYEHPEDPKSHVITDFIKMAKNGVIKMRTDGTEQRQFLHTEDCSKALLHWCENYNSYDKQKYIDITSFEWSSIKEVAEIIKSLIPCEIIMGQAKDSIQSGIKNNPSDYVLNFWKPELSLQQGIMKLI